MNNNVKLGIVGLLSVLLASVGTVVLTPTQMDKTYVCTMNQNVGVFDSLSDSGKTGYWVDGTGSHSSVCKNGQWELIKEYAKANNIDVSSLLESQAHEATPSGTIVTPGTGCTGFEKSYRCDTEKCQQIC